ncbi:MAG: AraC family transcriptional regulator [Cellulosilyticum sp.]|nr:AraC family transcriptional regulator [Cellulosilyticum sp.]MEE1070939.1 AraC family transcriptional regulator [Cellulosilyticum sp.]
MTVEELTKQLNLTCMGGKKGLGKEVTGVYIGDLLSLVMARSKEGDLWLTVQGHINTLAVAALVNMPAILLVEGILPTDEMIQKAEEEAIVLLTTHKTAYEMACALNKWL